jgi:SAM-dependent methyltransferase
MTRRFPESRLYGLDISMGMAQRAQRLYGDRAAVLVGDMERLPFRETSLDVIVTCWTLYFMPDIDGTLEEIKRCLKAGGRLVVGASAPDHMAEYDEVATAALHSTLGRRPEPNVGARFDLDSGEPYMRRHFQNVGVRHWRGWLILPEVRPLLQVWDAWRTDSLAGPDGDLVRAEFERLGREWLQRDGEIRISRHGGAFIGTKDA